MEMTILTSVLAAARVEVQQLHDEMATLRANYCRKISELADDFEQEDSKLRVRLQSVNGRIFVLLLDLDAESSSQPMELEDGVEQPKSLPAEVPAVEFEDEVELTESLRIGGEECLVLEFDEEVVELIVSATLIGA
jgi:hypothetical protein